MSTGKIIELLDEIASHVILLDPTNLPAIGEILNFFEKLDELLPAHGKNGRQIIQSSKKSLNAIILKSSPDPSSELEKTSKNITDLQHLVNDPGFGKISLENSDEAEDEKKGYEKDIHVKEEIKEPVTDDKKEVSPRKEKMRSNGEGEVFTLPYHVDQKIFHDFLGSQDSVLQDLEALILAVENGDTKKLEDLRRQLHTLKGEAGVIGLSDIEQVCHTLEDFLDQDPEKDAWIDMILHAFDWISKALASYSVFEMPFPSGKEIIRGFSKKLSKAAAPLSPGEQIKIETTKSIPLQDDPDSVSMLKEFLAEMEEELVEADTILLDIETEGQDDEKVNKIFRIFHSAKGVAGFLGLSDIISLAHQTETMLSRVRRGEIQLEAEILDLCFDATGMLRELMDGVDQAVKGDMVLSHNEKLPMLITGLEAAAKGFKPPEAKLPESEVGDRLGEIVKRDPILVPDEQVAGALKKQKDSGRKLGVELVTEGVQPKKVTHSLRSQRTTQKAHEAAKINEMIKVDLGRVDSLVSLVGELAVVESMLGHHFESMNKNLKRKHDVDQVKSHGTLRQFRKISKDLQDIGLSMRMVPVRSVFQKMTRLVRDLSKKQNKKMHLFLSGETTEMDRSMVEHIGDPLVHMIRNSADHGIEATDERIKAGKPAQGSIYLSAYHQGGNIIIEIGDDGRGLNKEGILTKAITNGIIGENDNLSEKEIYKIIFQPGFSTAKNVSEISGRGVGMDVVNRSIESMHGRISVDSKQGEGTVIKLILPLTLAIIDGMIIRCGPERHIIPTLSIVESFKPDPSVVLTFTGENELIKLRDELIPLIRLNRFLGIDGANESIRDLMVVVVESAGEKLGLLVDDILLRQQVVIKNLTTGDGKNPFFSGAAILSDGRIGLILNVDRMHYLMNQGYHENEKENPDRQTDGEEYQNEPGDINSNMEGMSG